MFVIKRNSVIITALVIMIAFAGYLNYIDHRNQDDPGLAEADLYGSGSTLLDDNIGQEVSVIRNSALDSFTGGTALIGSEIGISMTYEESEAGVGTNVNTSESEEREPGTAVFVNSTNDSSFFVQAKLEREQACSKSKETLLELINNSNLERDQKAQYADAMRVISDRLQKETATEAMIEAKGFTEAYVRIDDNGVDVVVSKAVLSDVELAQIEDIVKRKTGFEVDKITISPNKS